MRAALLATLLTVSLAEKFLILNDIHLDVNATYTMPMPGDMCNTRLLEVVLNNAKEQETKSGETLTAIFMPGDFVRHHLAADIG